MEKYFSYIFKGPNNEQFGSLTFPLPMNYLICRASDETAGLLVCSLKIEGK